MKEFHLNYMINPKKIFFTTFLLLSTLVFAQKIEYFSNKEGFNQNTINAIEGDRYGFIWFGTPNGLFKYDGYAFKPFTVHANTNGRLISNKISSLFNDSNGILWIGTNKGLNVYIPWLEKFLKVPLDIKTKITSIYEGPNNNIWFSGNHELYCCRLDVEREAFIVSENYLKSDFYNETINQFYVKENGSILMSTTKGLKMVTFKEEESKNSCPLLKTIIQYPEFDNQYVSSILKVNNVYWLGTKTGLVKATFEGTQLHVLGAHDKDKVLPNRAITELYKDKFGDLWVGTQNNGVFKYNSNDGSFLNYNYNRKNIQGLSSNYVKSLYLDEYDVLWIGTAQGGINKMDYNQKKFINYSHNPYESNSLPDNLITSILEDKSGYLWVTGYNERLSKSTQKVSETTVSNLKFENLSHKIPLPENEIIRCIYEDKKGFIWIGGYSSTIVYNPSDKSFAKVNFEYNGEVLSNRTIRDFYQLDDNTMMLIGGEVIVLENPWQNFSDKIVKVNVKQTVKLNTFQIFTVFRDHLKSLWFGTTKGLFKGKFDGDKVEIQNQYTDDENDKIHLNSTNVLSINQDANGVLWIGTYGAGLNKITLDAKGMPINVDYSVNNKLLADEAIYSILEQDKNLWFSTDSGLMKLNHGSNKVHVFDVRDGLNHNNFRLGAYFKGKSGFFYYGGLNGLTVFKPSTIQLNKKPPKVLITDLLINNKSVKIKEELNGEVVLEKSISETKEIKLSKNHNNLTFNLAVEHTATPSKNKLAYKLEGFNDLWLERNMGKAFVTYTNLSPGDYVFKVKAANGDGIWSSETKALKLIVLPPWYKTWWSYLLFTALVASVLIGVIVYFVKLELLKQRLNYEKIDKERMETVNDGKFKYFTNLSHEFRTPLTLIVAPLERLIEQNKDASSAKYFEIMKKNTNRLLSLVDQLITFRQAENGVVKLKLSKTTLEAFMDPIKEAFETYAIEKDINFVAKIESNASEEVIVDIEKKERIIFNLLSNSFKNTPEDGTISVELKTVLVNEKKWMSINVIDNGKGIAPEKLDNIFERFYQLGNENNKVSGGGIGLAFCKTLVDLLEGTIHVKSTPNVETCFSVLIPLTDSKDLDPEILIDNAQSFVKDFLPVISESNNVKKNNVAIKDADKRTILVVENETDVQTFLTVSLSDTYNIILANNGVEGLELLKKSEPDLIISDVMMPEMDGFEFCERVKSDTEICQIPVLMLTALGNDQDLIKGLEFGADAYISKPFTLKHLELRIEKLISNSIKLKSYFEKNSSVPDKNNDIEISSRDRLFLDQITSKIEKNISDSKFGVEDLANQIGLSTSQFYRRLKQLTGQAPNAYLRNYRLQRAAELLQNGKGMNVSQVMYSVGIESNSYFSSAFKKTHGMLPSEFMKQ
ncbi:response regulator [Tamlana agarivorans]|uniref:Response regulator n=1 Tax=Pseudotamlana agarivorans TaxID=481183 RepID=A0ACC5U9Q8_9FLAO|nr:two-component regulator propeller domain-containing protein [Tamlana agarivorans]MBU2950935.1 response regulator [Tamlana agarivorans]